MKNMLHLIMVTLFLSVACAKKTPITGTSQTIILSGDLNSIVVSQSPNYLEKYFKSSCSNNCGLTVPSVNHKRIIDFILTKNSSWEVKNYNGMAETYASDYRAIVVTSIIIKASTGVEILRKELSISGLRPIGDPANKLLTIIYT